MRIVPVGMGRRDPSDEEWARLEPHRPRNVGVERPTVKPWELEELGTFLDSVGTHRLGALFPFTHGDAFTFPLK